MKLNILIEETAKFSTADRIRKINRYMILVVGSLFMIMVLVLAGQFAYFQITLMNETAKAQALEKKYSQRSAEVVTYFRIKNLLVKAGEIVNTRTKYQRLLNEANLMFPDGVKMNSASFVNKSTLKVTAKANGVQDYASFLSRLKTLTSGNNYIFKVIIQNNLSRGENGNYTFALDLMSKI